MSNVTQEVANKALVSKMFQVVYGDGTNIDLLDEVIAPDYIQHNPHAGQGLAGVKTFFRDVLALPLPEGLGSAHTVQVNLIAEGEFVVRQEIRDHGMLVDVFRCADGRIAEHWDAYRANPGTEPPFGL